MMGRKKGLFSLFPLPIVPARFLFLSPQSPYDTKRPLWRGKVRELTARVDCISGEILACD